MRIETVTGSFELPIASVKDVIKYPGLAVEIMDYIYNRTAVHVNNELSRRGIKTNIILLDAYKVSDAFYFAEQLDKVLHIIDDECNPIDTSFVLPVCNDPNAVIKGFVQRMEGFGVDVYNEILRLLELLAEKDLIVHPLEFAKMCYAEEIPEAYKDVVDELDEFAKKLHSELLGAEVGVIMGSVLHACPDCKKADIIGEIISELALHLYEEYAGQVIGTIILDPCRISPDSGVITIDYELNLLVPGE